MPSALRILLSIALAACESSGAANERAAAQAHAGIALPGDCRGVWWDAAEQTLFLTDVTNDALIAWRDGRGFSTVVKLPPASSLGGVVRLADGRFVISSFGFGEGAVYVARGGAAQPLAGLAPARRRTGLALAPDGAIYAAYFDVAPGSVPRGGVARLELTDNRANEIDLGAADLRKPIGLAATARALYVTDQHRAALYEIPRAGGPATAVAPSVPSPELVVPLAPGDALAVATRTGAVYRVAGAEAALLGRDFEEVRGLAYDPAGARLFVVEHAAGRNQLHIVPVPPGK